MVPLLFNATQSVGGANSTHNAQTTLIPDSSMPSGLYPFSQNWKHGPRSSLLTAAWANGWNITLDGFGLVSGEVE